jgi:hypothetical protein
VRAIRRALARPPLSRCRHSGVGCLPRCMPGAARSGRVARRLARARAEGRSLGRLLMRPARCTPSSRRGQPAARRGEPDCLGARAAGADDRSLVPRRPCTNVPDCARERAGANPPRTFEFGGLGRAQAGCQGEAWSAATERVARFCLSSGRCSRPAGPCRSARTCRRPCGHHSEASYCSPHACPRSYTTVGSPALRASHAVRGDCGVPAGGGCSGLRDEAHPASPGTGRAHARFGVRTPCVPFVSARPRRSPS